MYIEARHLLPTMQIMLDFKEQVVVNVELHYEQVRLLSNVKDVQCNNVYEYRKMYELPKDVFLKILHNPYD
jgi:hypothetical protein